MRPRNWSRWVLTPVSIPTTLASARFLLSGDRADEAERVIERANSPDEDGLIAPIVLAVVSNRVRDADDEATAEEAIRAIRDYKHVDSLPLIDEITE